MRRTFGKEDLESALREIGSRLERPVTCYLIGGCAMTFLGQKVVTKDVDLVVLASDDLADLLKAMEASGFSRIPKPENEYRDLGASVIMEDPKGMRFDLFGEVVCRKLRFSGGMRNRSSAYGTFSKLTLQLAAPEDIFLLKGVTDRPDDLDDMSVLAARGLAWETIKQECLAQESGRNWASHLVEKLEDLKERYDVTAPIAEELRQWAEVQAMRAVVLRFLGGRERSFGEIRDFLQERYDFSDQDTEDELSRLVDHGILRMRKRRSARHYQKGD